MKEGYALCKFMYKRMFIQNKNILAVINGATGTGKSYLTLRHAELWYKHVFKEKFPKENLCFGIGKLLKTIRHKKKHNLLRRGELFILEEAGVNLASLDFQKKIAKAFNYVLQSFRSLNIGIMFNLPYFTMLNKTTRELMHIQIKMRYIDKKKKKSYAKPFTLQYSDERQKLYRHYLKFNDDGFLISIDTISYKLADKEFRDYYEKEKEKFVLSTIDNAIEECDVSGKVLTILQKDIMNLVEKGLYSPTYIAKILKKKQGLITTNITFIRKKGYEVIKTSDYKQQKEVYDRIIKSKLT